MGLRSEPLKPPGWRKRRPPQVCHRSTDATQRPRDVEVTRLQRGRAWHRGHSHSFLDDLLQHIDHLVSFLHFLNQALASLRVGSTGPEFQHESSSSRAGHPALCTLIPTVLTRSRTVPYSRTSPSAALCFSPANKLRPAMAGTRVMRWFRPPPLPLQFRNHPTHLVC